MVSAVIGMLIGIVVGSIVTSKAQTRSYEDMETRLHYYQELSNNYQKAYKEASAELSYYKRQCNKNLTK